MSEQLDLFAPGERFRGYQVERLLGRGGLGAVYLVRHELLDTLFALKVLYPDVAVNRPEYVKRFLREAKLATRVRHPNLVAVHDCGIDETKGLYYLVMDYVSGGDLRGTIAFSGKLEPARAARIIAQAAGALSAAQAFDVVHRDLKPENIMLQADGSVKLVDLGIAKAKNLGDTFATKTASVFGTPAYVSPEQAIDAAKVDFRADIYSLGIVFFEMVTGHLPYEGKNPAQQLVKILSPEPVPDPREFEPSVPERVVEVIRHMTAKKVDERTESYARLFQELAGLGYDLGLSNAPQAEYATGGSALEAEKPLNIDLEKMPANNSTLSMETDDPEVKAFIDGLKARKRRVRSLCLVGGLVLAAMALAVLALLLFR